MTSFRTFWMRNRTQCKLLLFLIVTISMYCIVVLNQRKMGAMFDVSGFSDYEMDYPIHKEEHKQFKMKYIKKMKDKIDKYKIMDQIEFDDIAARQDHENDDIKKYGDPLEKDRNVPETQINFPLERPDNLQKHIVDGKYVFEQHEKVGKRKGNEEANKQDIHRPNVHDEDLVQETLAQQEDDSENDHNNGIVAFDSNGNDNNGKGNPENEKHRIDNNGKDDHENEKHRIDNHGINNNGNDINRNNNNGNDINGKDINGNDINGNDINGNYINGNDINGNDIIGNDINGNDINGNDINGNDINGNDNNGNDINGNDNNGNDNNGNYNNGKDNNAKRYNAADDDNNNSNNNNNNNNHTYSDVIKFRQERYLKHQSRGERSGPGENGTPVSLTENEKEIAEKNNQSVTEVLSQKVALDRSILDTRHPSCKRQEYPKDLPVLSAILIFCNEPRSPLLRCIHSIINRTPPEYLKEIILVDDFSDNEDLMKPLDDIVQSSWPDGIVKIVRRTERGGLIRARMTGARAAIGDVLVVMDGHMEVNKEWAQPLLARIKEKPDTVVMPVIDIILDDNFAYSSGGNNKIVGFMWSMFYKWMDPPKQEMDSRKSPLDPIRSPSIMGCVFAVNREYFFHIGGFDEGMIIWGAENVELAFRVWMCGGSVELIPCSRMGHLYRTKRPYSMTNKAGNTDTMSHNAKRVAEVWLDDYKRIFYMRMPHAVNINPGDLSDRIALRNRLNCHSFKWYLENVQPDQFVFDENVYGWGRISNPSTDLCLDTVREGEQEVHKSDVLVKRCVMDNYLDTQLMGLNLNAELRLEMHCLQATTMASTPVHGMFCHGNKGNQEWKHSKETLQIVHVLSGLCLDMEEPKEEAKVVVNECTGSETQKWQIDHYMDMS